MSKSNRPKPTIEQKAEVLRLLQANTPKEEVAKQTKLSVSQVGGLIGSFRRAGELPNYQTVGGAPFVNPEHAAAKRTPRRAAAQADDGFDWAVSGDAGDGFGSPGISYEVERILPADCGGLLGRHDDPFTKEDVARIYGGMSRYRLKKFVPGQPALKTEFDVSETYGPPKTPNRFRDERGRGEDDIRVRPDGRRPAEGARGRLDEGGGAPPSWAREHLAREHFSRESQAGERSAHGVITTLVDKLTATAPGNTNDEKSIVFEMLRKQETADKAVATRADQARIDEKKREDDRRRDEKTRDDARNAEATTARNEAATEREKAHAREIASIEAMGKAREGWEKQVQNALRDIDSKRLDLLDDRHKMREKELKDEITRSREEMQDVRNSVKEDMADLRKQQEKEFALREKLLDQKGAHGLALLELQKKINSGDSTSLIIEALKEFGTKAENAVGKMAKVREMEIRAGGGAPLPAAEEETDGNLGAEAAAPAAGTPAAAGAPNGNGGGADDMQAVLDKILGSPLFKGITDEWREHIVVGNDATMFANMFLEWMRDPRPEQTETRQACSTFANSMSARAWPRMLALLRPHLQDNPETLAVFESEAAGPFYEGFRFIVCEHIRDYYRDYVNSRRAGAPATEAPAPAPEGGGADTTAETTTPAGAGRKPQRATPKDPVPGAEASPD